MTKKDNKMYKKYDRFIKLTMKDIFKDNKVDFIKNKLDEGIYEIYFIQGNGALNNLITNNLDEAIEYIKYKYKVDDIKIYEINNKKMYYDDIDYILRKSIIYLDNKELIELFVYTM